MKTNEIARIKVFKKEIIKLLDLLAILNFLLAIANDTVALNAV